MQIKTKMLILPSEREKGRRVGSRHVAALFAMYRTQLFQQKTIDFSVKMVKIFFAGLPPRTPVRTHTPVSRYTSPPPRGRRETTITPSPRAPSGPGSRTCV